jgi:YgiT-type zinc finger domain-containing protein
MAGNVSEETFVEQKVTYTLEIEGRFVIVEHVPARVSVKTGERYFSPETVERLQQVVWEGKSPSRVVETPVFEYPDVRA